MGNNTDATLKVMLSEYSDSYAVSAASPYVISGMCESALARISELESMNMSLTMLVTDAMESDGDFLSEWDIKARELLGLLPRVEP